MYDKPITRTYRFPAIDFDATTGDVCLIPVLEGRAGRIRSVHLENVTVEFTAGDGAAGFIQFGDGSDVDKYYDSGAIETTSQINTKNVVELPDDGAAANIEAGRANITGTFTAATGTGDGTADVVVTIEWF